MTFGGALDSKVYNGDFCEFHLGVCTFIWQSISSAASGTSLSFFPLLSVGEMKNIIYTMWPWVCFMFRTQWRKRCVWGNLSRNLTSVAMTRMPSISRLLFICRRKPGIGIGKPIYAFFNIYIFVFEEDGRALHLAALRVPWVHCCHAGESQCLAVSSLASFSVRYSISEDMYMVAYVHNLDINT